MQVRGLPEEIELDELAKQSWYAALVGEEEQAIRRAFDKVIAIERQSAKSESGRLVWGA